MKIFSILIFSLYMIAPHTSFSCGKQRNNRDDGFYLTHMSEKDIQAAPVFHLKKQVFERLCANAKCINTWFDICLETDEIAQYLLAQGFTPFDFLAVYPRKNIQKYGTTALKFRTCPAGTNGEQPSLIFEILSKEVPVFNVTYNEDKTAITHCERTADQPRHRHIHAVGRIVAAQETE